MAKGLVGALTAVGILAGALESNAASTIKVANFTPPKGTSVAGVFVPWMAAVDKAAGGELKMQGYWGGALGRHPAKQYDLVKNGIADVAFIVVAYQAGQFPDFSVLELPLLVRTANEGAVAAWRLYKQGLIGGLDEIHPVGLFTNEPNGIHSKIPIRSLDDLKGVKIRATGATQSMLLKQFGAVPIGMPVTQITESLSRGIIEATMVNLGALYAFRLNNVTSHHFLAPLGVSPFMMAMNREKYKSLSAKARAAIDDHSGNWLANLAGKAFDDQRNRVYARARKDGDRTVVELSGAALDREAAKVKPIHQAWIAKTDDGQRKYDALVKILADIRAGK